MARVQQLAHALEKRRLAPPGQPAIPPATPTYAPHVHAPWHHSDHRAVHPAALSPSTSTLTSTSGPMAPNGIAAMDPRADGAASSSVHR